MFPGKGIYNVSTPDGGHGRIASNDKPVTWKSDSRLFKTQLYQALLARLNNLTLENDRPCHDLSRVKVKANPLAVF